MACRPPDLVGGDGQDQLEESVRVIECIVSLVHPPEERAEGRLQDILVIETLVQVLADLTIDFPQQTGAKPLQQGLRQLIGRPRCLLAPGNISRVGISSALVQHLPIARLGALRAIAQLGLPLHANTLESGFPR